MQIIKGKIIKHEKKGAMPFVRFEDGFICSLPAVMHMKFGISEVPEEIEAFIKGFYNEPLEVEQPEGYGLDMKVTGEYNKISDAYKAGKQASIQAKYDRSEVLITEYD